ncbi:hypothetical protein Scep_014820 [Stephania cephalantha]|uniref:Uncharacterized protein n=1 Tax=Stephania cephalantha TaxID=152367 RepID=A0AAP0J1Z6_9MAGN
MSIVHRIAQIRQAFHAFQAVSHVSPTHWPSLFPAATRLQSGKGKASSTISPIALATDDLKHQPLIILEEAKLHVLVQTGGLLDISKGSTIVIFGLGTVGLLMPYLDEWSTLECEYSSSLSAAIKALQVASVQLPISGNVKSPPLHQPITILQATAKCWIRNYGNQYGGGKDPKRLTTSYGSS